MNLLEPTNHRISNSLFDAINKVRNGETAQPQQLEESNSVDKAHFCATHVEHALLGKGTCISEQHAEPDENGDIAWYSVEFPTGIQRVETSNLKIVEGKSHSHSKKMAEEEEGEEKETVKEALSGNQHKIDANKNNKIDAHDFKLLRAKKKPVEEGPGSQALFLSGNTSLTQLFSYVVDIKIGDTINVDSFDVYINDYYYGSDLELIQINSGDVLRLEIVKDNPSTESTIQFIDKIF